MINVFQPSLGNEELEVLKEVFHSNWLGRGPRTEKFTTEFADHLGVDRKHLTSASCCTAGLFNIMRLQNFKPKDEVVIPTVAFVGAANAIAATGAKIVFCDVDPRTLNTTAELISKVLTPQTKAIVVNHFGGIACDMESISALAHQHNLTVIEDGACGVASTYHGKALGTLADFGVWSFDAMKILVCGDGAMIYSRDPENTKKLEHQLYLGLSSKSGFTNSVDAKWWEFEIDCFGERSIMNDISAAIGSEQLKKLPQFIEFRRKIHKFYLQELSQLSFLTMPPPIPENCQSSYYFFWIQTTPEKRNALSRFLREREIYTTYRYYPLHFVKLYGCTHQHFPGAEAAANTTLCLPIYQALTQTELQTITGAIKSFSGRVAE